MVRRKCQPRHPAHNSGISVDRSQSSQSAKSPDGKPNFSRCEWKQLAAVYRVHVIFTMFCLVGNSRRP
jgi:hypothetical protein